MVVGKRLVAMGFVRHEELVPRRVRVSFNPLRCHARGGKGGPDDSLVEWAHEFMREVLVDRHPEALLDFLGLHCQVGIEGSETAYEVDIGFSVPIAVPMPEADQRLKPGLDAGLLEDFAGHGIDKMLTGLKCPTGKLVIASACGAVTFAYDE